MKYIHFCPLGKHIDKAMVHHNGLEFDLAPLTSPRRETSSCFTSDDTRRIAGCAQSVNNLGYRFVEKEKKE